MQTQAPYAYGYGFGLAFDANWAGVPYIEGRKAKFLGTKSKNPYSLGSQEHEEYELGYHSNDNPRWPGVSR